MDGTLKFFFPVQPQAKQSMKVAVINGKLATYRNKSVSSSQADLRALAAAQMGDRVPFDRKAYIRVKYIDFIYPVPKSFSLKKILKLQSGCIFWKNSKPDADNLCKLVFDSLKNLVYYDDAQIVEIGCIRKRYGIKPGIAMELEEIQDGQTLPF